MFVSACECDKRVYSTRTGLGLDRVLSVRCCAAAYCLPGRDLRLEFILELVRHILRSYVRYGVRHRQTKQCIL